MKKQQQLFDEILKIKGVNKSNVLAWAENITTSYQATASADDGFTQNYTAMFLIQALSSSNQIIERITMYLSKYDRHDSKPIFNTDILNNETIDLMFQIDLEEQAIFVKNEESGEWSIDGVKHDLNYVGFTDDDLNEFTGAEYDGY